MIAYLLQKKGIDVLILEANTLGGRIETVTGTTGQQWKWVPPGLVNHISILIADELNIVLQATHQGISFFETMSFVPPQNLKFQMPKNLPIE
jgi:monoamine oxidase